MARVVVLGNANVDLTSYVERAPSDGETVIGTDFTIGMGGKGANQAVATARAGVSTAFIGRVGDDSFGEFMWQGLSAEGLDLTHLRKVPGSSGVAAITVDPSGTNRIAVFLGASATLTPGDAEKALESCADAAIMVSQLELGHDVVRAGLQKAHSLGQTTVLNTAPYRALTPDVLEVTDWLIANEVEAEELLRDTGIDPHPALNTETVASSVSQWAERLGTNLIITLGEAGAIGVVRGSSPHQATAPAVSAIDTVGAGDCFVGFFVALLVEGVTWQQAIDGAVIAASQSVQHPGAQSSYPSGADAAEIRDALSNQ